MKVPFLCKIIYVEIGFFLEGQAVEDKLPTAKVKKQDDGAWIVEAETFGKGIDMWLRSQGYYVQIIRKG